MKIRLSMIIIIVGLLCSGCKTVPEETPVVVMLESNLTGIVGVLQDEQKKPISGQVVRAAIVVWNEDKTAGSFILDGAHSPSTISEDNGVFKLMNIVSQEYVIIVGDIERDPLVIPEIEGSNKAKIFVPMIGEVLDVGILIIN